MSYVKSEQVKNPKGITDESAHIFLEGSWKYFILAPLEELGKHVLSFWVKGKTTGNMAINYADEQINIPITTEWQRVVFKFTAKSITNIWIYFSGTEYWMYNTQLELGDFATDYSKNPEEVEDGLKNDIANTKEQVEQYRKETSAEILVTQQSITQSVTSLEERVSKNYYTKTESNSLIAQTQDRILQTVSVNITETKTYADTVATNAKNAAITDTDNKLKSYSTTTQMNSAIDQRANSITSTVNVQITETKKYADTVAGNAKKESIEETTTKFQTQIAQTQSSILQTVSATYATNGTVDQVKSSVASVEVTANKINWIVKSGTSSSDFALTDRTATLVANYINLKGLVQFSGLDSSTQSTINKVSLWSSSSDTTLIDGGKIYTGTITADKIKIDSLQAISAKIGGFTIGSSYIANGTTTLGGSATSVYLGTNGISCGSKFKVTNSGVITAIGGTIGGFTISEKYLANGTTTLGGSSTSVYLGTNGISCGSKFKVTNSGEITATGGKIGGFTIGSNSLYSGKTSISSTNTGIYIGTDGISIGASGKPALKVTSSGELSIGYNGAIEFTSGTYNMKLTSSGLEFKEGYNTTTLEANKISLGFINIERTSIQCGGSGAYTKIENKGVTVHTSSYETVVEDSGITIKNTNNSNSVLDVYGKATFRKDVDIGGSGSISIKLGHSSSYTSIGFFGHAASSRKSVTKVSTSGTPTVSQLRTAINNLITALQGYGLIG